MAFEPGNQEAKKGNHKRQRAFAAELKMALAEVDASGRNGLRRLAEALIDKAVTDRDVTAIREIADRIDGKVAQAIVGDDEHDPLTVRQAPDPAAVEELVARFSRARRADLPDMRMPLQQLEPRRTKRTEE